MFVSAENSTQRNSLASLTGDATTEQDRVFIECSVALHVKDENHNFDDTDCRVLSSFIFVCKLFHHFLSVDTIEELLSLIDGSNDVYRTSQSQPLCHDDISSPDPSEGDVV